MRERAEAIYVDVMATHVGEERMRAVFQQSAGLCLPHFQAVLRATTDTNSARLIADVQQDRLRSLKQDLELFLHKMDAHYHQNIGAEGTSWLHALARVAGEKDAG